MVSFSKQVNSVFTLSLDCEGYWGMADQLDVVNSGVITDASLSDAYSWILNLLDENNLKATAAFVTCFAVETDVVIENMDLIKQMAKIEPAWFKNILSAYEGGSLDGWNGSSVHVATSSAGHEMAWHGATHLPLSSKTSTEAVEIEIELASRLFHELDYTPRTIIFPRNQIGHLDLLRTHGFESYRAQLSNGFTKKLSGLANEWNIWDRGGMERVISKNSWQISPAGNFLNWPSGVRALVPPSVTVMRWKSLLRYAVENGGYVHMWLHPHNLITSPAMKVAFAEIIQFASQLVGTSDMHNLTISEANECIKKGI